MSDDYKLTISYSALHDLAGSARDLSGTIQRELGSSSPSGIVSASGSPVSPSDVGYSTALGAQDGRASLYEALTEFYGQAQQPFQQSIDQLDRLASLFDGISDAFFNADAQFAAGTTAGLTTNAEAAAQQSGQSNHDLLQATAPAGTVATYDSKGRVSTETTTIRSPDGQVYTETTSYTYGAGNSFTTTSVVQGMGGASSRTTTNYSAPGSPVSSTSVAQGTTTTTTFGAGGTYTSRATDSSGTATLIHHPATGPDTRTVTSGTTVTYYTGDAQNDTWHEVWQHDGRTIYPTR
jgi:hypothetical protein